MNDTRTSTFLGLLPLVVGTAASLLACPAQAAPSAVPDARPAPSPRIISGTGLMIGAGVLTAASITQQAAAYTTMQATCGVASANGTSLSGTLFDDSTVDPREENSLRTVGGLGLLCAGAADPAIRLRIGAGLALAGSFAAATSGALLRGRRDAYDDLFAHRRRKSALPLQIAGGTLLAAGFAVWTGTRIALPTGKTRCKTMRCYLIYDFATLQSSAMVATAGAAMLAYGSAYRNQSKRLKRAAGVKVGGSVGPVGGMLSLTGAF